MNFQVFQKNLKILKILIFSNFLIISSFEYIFGGQKYTPDKNVEPPIVTTRNEGWCEALTPDKHFYLLFFFEDFNMFLF